ncbi:TPA: hypothetical protein ACPSKE_003300 [Legionella feeleii]
MIDKKSFSKCYSHFVQWLKKLLSFSASTFVASFLGIIFVAIILSSLNWLSPELYKWVTYWANQKQIPTVLACKFKKISTPNFVQINKYTWYDVEIFLSHAEEVGSALVYSTNEFMSVQKNEEDVKLTSTKDDPYVVLWKLKFSKTIPNIRVQVKNEYLSFKENTKYPYSACPIKVEFFIDD